MNHEKRFAGASGKRPPSAMKKFGSIAQLLVSTRPHCHSNSKSSLFFRFLWQRKHSTGPSPKLDSQSCQKGVNFLTEGRSQKNPKLPSCSVSRVPLAALYRRKRIFFDLTFHRTTLKAEVNAGF